MEKNIQLKKQSVTEEITQCIQDNQKEIEYETKEMK